MRTGVTPPVACEGCGALHVEGMHYVRRRRHADGSYVSIAPKTAGKLRQGPMPLGEMLLGPICSPDCLDLARGQGL